MSNIKELLNGVEVEWKSLGEVIELKKGKQLSHLQIQPSSQANIF